MSWQSLLSRCCEDDFQSRVKNIFQISREAKRERVKTKEEQQEEKRIALSIRIKSMELDGRNVNSLISLQINVIFLLHIQVWGRKVWDQKLLSCGKMWFGSRQKSMILRWGARDRDMTWVRNMRPFYDTFITHLKYSFKSFKHDKPSVWD